MAEASEWAAHMGEEWARLAEPLERQLAEAGAVGIAALAPRPGERILDLGCGSGATTAAIAETVGPEGGVTGVDISPALLETARRRPALAGATLIRGDAAEVDLPGGHDALFSRFGCMFFDNPPAAFAHLREALRPGARAVLVVWADIAENPWARIPAEVGTRLLGPPEPGPATAPGPFAWADMAYARWILETAGFTEVTGKERDIGLEIGMGESDDPLARGVAMLSRVGPLARRLKALEPEARAPVTDALAGALAPFVRDGALRMTGRVRVIRARS